MKKFFANKNIFYPVLLILSFILLHILFIWIGKCYEFETYSDSVAALFSGLAFVFLIISIQKQTQSIDIQKQDLNLQLQEFRNSIEEQKKANELLENQLKSNEIFKFEEFLHRYQESSYMILSSLTYNFENKEYTGADVFGLINQRIAEDFIKVMNNSGIAIESNSVTEKERQALNDAFSSYSGQSGFGKKVRIYLTNYLSMFNYIYRHREKLGKESYGWQLKFLYHNTDIQVIRYIVMYFLFNNNSLLNFRDLVMELDLNSSYKPIEGQLSDFDEKIGLILEKEVEYIEKVRTHNKSVK